VQFFVPELLELASDLVCGGAQCQWNRVTLPNVGSLKALLVKLLEEREAALSIFVVEQWMPGIILNPFLRIPQGDAIFQYRGADLLRKTRHL
jgi:hypothetical protein